jgi:hypothetical protein
MKSMRNVFAERRLLLLKEVVGRPLRLLAEMAVEVLAEMEIRLVKIVQRSCLRNYIISY